MLEGFMIWTETGDPIWISIIIQQNLTDWVPK